MRRAQNWRPSWIGARDKMSRRNAWLAPPSKDPLHPKAAHWANHCRSSAPDGLFHLQLKPR